MTGVDSVQLPKVLGRSCLVLKTVLLVICTCGCRKKLGKAKDHAAHLSHYPSSPWTCNGLPTRSKRPRAVLIPFWRAHSNDISGDRCCTLAAKRGQWAQQKLTCSSYWMCGTTVAKVKLKSKIHIQLRYGDISGKLHTSGQSEKGCKVNKSSSRMNFSGFDTKNIKQVWSGRQKCPSGNWSSKYPSTKHLLAGRSHLGWRASMVLVPDSHQSRCLKFCITFSHHDSRWSKGPIVGCLTLLSSAKSQWPGISDFSTKTSCPGKAWAHLENVSTHSWESSKILF